MILAEAEVKTKAELHEAMVRNGYYMPSYKSSIVTISWMKGIRKGTVWCPKYEELRLRPCYSPPSKDSIVDEINHILEKNNLDMGLARDNAPKVSWLLAVLSTLHSRHAFFAKGYVPPKQIKEAKRIDNSDGFFTGLPPKQVLSKSIFRLNTDFRLNMLQNQIPSSNNDINYQLSSTTDSTQQSQTIMND
jgi:hypothetical protein